MSLPLLPRRQCQTPRSCNGCESDCYCRPAGPKASETTFAFPLLAIVPSEPLLHESFGDAHFHADGYRARTSFDLSQARSGVGGTHALQRFIPATLLLSVVAPRALLVGETLLCHLPSENIPSAKSRNATTRKVGTLTMLSAKRLINGGSDGARTRDLRRDRPAPIHWCAPSGH
jgi:hypothetical protein